MLPRNWIQYCHPGPPASQSSFRMADRSPRRCLRRPPASSTSSTKISEVIIVVHSAHRSCPLRGVRSLQPHARLSLCEKELGLLPRSGEFRLAGGPSIQNTESAPFAGVPSGARSDGLAACRKPPDALRGQPGALHLIRRRTPSAMFPTSIDKRHVIDIVTRANPGSCKCCVLILLLRR